MATVFGLELAVGLVEEKKVLELLECNQSILHSGAGWLEKRAADIKSVDQQTRYAVGCVQFALSTGWHDLFVTHCQSASVAIATVFVAFVVANLLNAILAK